MKSLFSAGKRNYFLYVLVIQFLLLSGVSFAQVTIVLGNADKFSNEIKNNLYVAGNFNDWNPGDENFKLKSDSGIYSITFFPDKNLKQLEFKFTRGSWETGEVLFGGKSKQNRVYSYLPEMVLIENVESFQDLEPADIKIANANVLQFKVYSDELKREKNIRIYLPCDYATSTKSYPVLYMLDGQNLFDDVYSFAGEWGVDENMDSICSMGLQTSIIVGIDHANDLRISEYTPWYINNEYGGGEGDAFAQFLVHTLKPKIDSFYRTKPQREFTAVAGSSVAGAESFYIVLKYNTAFSKGGIFSPSFWISENYFETAHNFNSVLSTELYFICGAREGDDVDMMKYMEKMYDVLLDNNLQNLNMRLVVESTGIHSESFWRSQFIELYRWLYSE